MSNGGQSAARPARPGGIRGRMSRLRVLIAVVVVGFGAVGFYGGLFSSSSAEPTVQAFLLDWAQRDYQAAAQLTTGDKAAVAQQLQTAYRQLHAAAFYLSMGPIKQRPDTAQASFNASVDLGQDGAPWTYQGRFSLRRFGSSWKVLWSPAVINPGLRPGLRLAVVTRVPPRAQLLDASGNPLQPPSPAYAVGVRPGGLAHPGQTASSLAEVTGLDPAQLLGQIVAAPRTRFLQLLTLSPASYRHLHGGLQRVPGLIVRPGSARLFTSLAPDVVGQVGTEISPVLRDEGVSYHPGSTVGLSGLQHAYQSQLAGSPTTQVVAESADGTPVRVLARWSGQPSTPVRTTIDARVQRAADSATSAAGTSAAVVALQASTGRILAVADSRAAGLPRINPLAGHYPPGGAFTIVSTEALLATQLPLDAQIRCTSSSNVGGHTFVNVPPVQLSGQPTFASDFAHGCGTAFTYLSRRLDPGMLSDAAQGFGFGSQLRLPLTAFSGSLSSDGGGAGLAANTIGQGGVQVSPLGMAMVAANVDAGGWHSPSLTSSPAQTQATGPAAFPTSRMQALRSLMRTAVRSGAARRANLSGQPIYGQVGVAPSGKNLWASWFVGYRGDLAFAVLQLSKSPQISAAPAAAQFLSAAPG